MIASSLCTKVINPSRHQNQRKKLQKLVVSFEKNLVTGSALLDFSEVVPQFFEPIPDTTLALKGTGEFIVETDGQEKDRVTTQYAATLDGVQQSSYHAGLPAPSAQHR